MGRLAAGLAHEIGNPISAIMGFQDLLLEGELSKSEERDFLERMRRETERVHKVLRDLLDFARPADHALQPPESRVGMCSLSDVLSHLGALVRPQPRFTNVTLSFDHPANMPPIAIRRDQLEQILLNLL